MGDLEETVSEWAESDVARIGGRAGATRGMKLKENDVELKGTAKDGEGAGQVDESVDVGEAAVLRKACCEG